MCHVSRGECELVDAGGELGVDCVKGFLEGSWDGAVAWQGRGETRAEETVVDPGEEEGGTETGLGDAVRLGVCQAFDHAVEA